MIRFLITAFNKRYDNYQNHCNRIKKYRTYLLIILKVIKINCIVYQKKLHLGKQPKIWERLEILNSIKIVN